MIRKSAEVNIAVLDHVAEHIKAGMTTEEIDMLVYQKTTDLGGIPAPLGFEGFPKSVCTSINDQVCHGIPSKDDVLKEGDIVNVDVSTILNDFYSDSSRMFCIGNVSEGKRRLVEVAKECVELGLKEVKPWDLWVICLKQFMTMPLPMATLLFEKWAAMVSVWNFMKIPLSVMSVSVIRKLYWHRE